jgi:phosphoenolpyruvate carboxylase
MTRNVAADTKLVQKAGLSSKVWSRKLSLEEHMLNPGITTHVGHIRGGTIGAGRSQSWQRIVAQP